MNKLLSAQWGFGGGWNGGGWGGPGWGFSPWWCVGGLAVMAGIGVLIFYLVRRSRWQPSFVRPGSVPQSAAAEEMLARRFAAGEISEEEYLSRLAVLRGPGQ